MKNGLCCWKPQKERRLIKFLYMPILSPYTNHWITSFNLIKIELQLALAGIDFVIEHVGSTAVPNLDAKPIIDIDIIFSVFEQALYIVQTWYIYIL